MDFSFMPEVSPQSMALTSLFETFVPTHDFGEMVGANESIAANSEPWMNDALFGFMNEIEFQDTEGTGWNGHNGGNTV
jgi:hypothetical protein